jgi:hypothetical protein
MGEQRFLERFPAQLGQGMAGDHPQACVSPRPPQPKAEDQRNDTGKKDGDRQDQVPARKPHEEAREYRRTVDPVNQLIQ